MKNEKELKSAFEEILKKELAPIAKDLKEIKDGIRILYLKGREVSGEDILWAIHSINKSKETNPKSDGEIEHCNAFTKDL